MERLKNRITERWKSSKGNYCIMWLKFYRIQGMAKTEIKKRRPQASLLFHSALFTRYCRAFVPVLISALIAAQVARYDPDMNLVVSMHKKKTWFLSPGLNSGGRIRTCDLRVMGPTSYQTALPRDHFILYTKIFIFYQEH